MPSLSRNVFEFGPFRLEPAESRLTRDGVRVHVTPKALELLVALVTRPGRLMTKEELVAEVWPDTFVEEGNLAVSMTRLRQALNDDTGQAYVETVPKKGYRFVATVREVVPEAPPLVPITDRAESRPVPVTDQAQPARPRWFWTTAAISIAAVLAGAAFVFRAQPNDATGPVQSLVVTRFTSISASGGQSHLEQGIPDALTTRLASLRQLRVPPTAVLRAGEDPFATARLGGRDPTGSVQRTAISFA